MEGKTEKNVDRESPTSYNVGTQDENFSSKITEIAESFNLSLLQSVVIFCDYHDITLKKAAKMLSPKLISLIAEEEGIEGIDLTQLDGGIQ